MKLFLLIVMSMMLLSCNKKQEVKVEVPSQNGSVSSSSATPSAETSVDPNAMKTACNKCWYEVASLKDLGFEEARTLFNGEYSKLNRADQKKAIEVLSEFSRTMEEPRRCPKSGDLPECPVGAKALLKLKEATRVMLAAMETQVKSGKLVTIDSVIGFQPYKPGYEVIGEMESVLHGELDRARY